MLCLVCHHPLKDEKGGEKMCLHQRLSCVCGKNEAYLFHRNDILPEGVVVKVYCPACAHEVSPDSSTMVEDVGWLIEYDMEAAEFFLQQGGIDGPVTPEFIFDEEYCSWYGLSPNDLEENARLHQELLPLQKRDKKSYINRLKEKRLRYVEELKKAGWRKAQKA
jgi:hypothetical protein